MPQLGRRTQSSLIVKERLSSQYANDSTPLTAITTAGDVPPLAMIKASPTTQIETPGGIALNPEDNEVIIDGGGSPPKVLVFHAPELFN